MKKQSLFIMTSIFLIYSAANFANTNRCRAMLDEKIILTNQHCFNMFVSGVSEGDKVCIAFTPALSGKINSVQSIALRDALVNALLSAPAETLETLNKIDSYISQQDEDSDTDRIGSNSVCATLPDPVVYNKPSFLEYAERANKSLKATGQQGVQCLSLVNGVVDEVLNDEKRGRVKWGLRSYSFDEISR